MDLLKLSPWIMPLPVCPTSTWEMRNGSKLGAEGRDDGRRLVGTPDEWCLRALRWPFIIVAVVP